MKTLELIYCEGMMRLTRPQVLPGNLMRVTAGLTVCIAYPAEKNMCSGETIMPEAACIDPDESGTSTELPTAHTFIVRVWLENLGGGRTEWRGRVQDVVSGEVSYFRRWRGLVQVIRELLASRT